jgi:hypothetical protein
MEGHVWTCHRTHLQGADGKLEDRMKPRFSMKTLLAAMTLIAIGIVMVVAVPRSERLGVPLSVCFVMWFGGGGLIGAGLFALFQRHWTGAVFGVAVMGIVFCLLNTEVISW